MLVSLLHEGGQFVTRPQSVICTLRYSVGFPGPRCWVSADDSLLGWCVWCILLLKEQSSTRDAQESGVRAGLPLDPRPLAVSISPKMVKAINLLPPPSWWNNWFKNKKQKKHLDYTSSVLAPWWRFLIGFYWDEVLSFSRCVHGNPIAGGHELCAFSLPPAPQHRFCRSQDTGQLTAVLDPDKHPAVEGRADGCLVELVTWLRVSLTTLRLTLLYQLKSATTSIGFIYRH